MSEPYEPLPAANQIDRLPTGSWIVIVDEQDWSPVVVGSFFDEAAALDCALQEAATRCPHDCPAPGRREVVAVSKGVLRVLLAHPMGGHVGFAVTVAQRVPVS